MARPKDEKPKIQPGSQEEIILRLVMHNRGEAFGRKIRDDYQDLTKKEPALTTIYSVLERLEAKGFVTAEWIESTGQRGGRRKQLWSITGDGIFALQAAEHIQEKMRTSLPIFIRNTVRYYNA
jgi:PadR family transcriptional regulator, regulatory protein PadR